MAINWQGALQGGLGGAGTGAILGGPIGAGIGALGGGLAGLFGGGKEGGFKQLQTQNPQQQQLMQWLLSQGKSQFQNPSQGFQPIAGEAMRRYQQDIVPGLAERFSSMGSNALSSPAYAQQQLGAGADLASQLAAMEAQYGMQNRNQALQLLQMGMQPSFENYYEQGQPGLGERLLGGTMQGLQQPGGWGQMMDMLKMLRTQQPPAATTGLFPTSSGYNAPIFNLMPGNYR